MSDQSNKQATSTSKDGSAAIFKNPLTKSYFQTEKKVMNISSESELVEGLIINLHVDAQIKEIDQKFTSRVNTLIKSVRFTNKKLGSCIELVERKIRNIQEVSAFSRRMNEVASDLSDSNTSNSSSSTAQPAIKRRKKSPMTFEFTMKKYLKTIVFACQAVKSLVIDGNMEECLAILSVSKEVRDEILNRFIEECENLSEVIKKKTSSEQRREEEDLEKLIDEAAKNWFLGRQSNATNGAQNDATSVPTSGS